MACRADQPQRPCATLGGLQAKIERDRGCTGGCTTITGSAVMRLTIGRPRSQLRNSALRVAEDQASRAGPEGPGRLERAARTDPGGRAGAGRYSPEVKTNRRAVVRF